MQLDYGETGTGPALVFLPGSFSNMSAFRAIQSALAGHYRLINTSLPGYGGTQEVRPDAVKGMGETLGFCQALADKVAAPFHLVGHSYGGQIALAAALDGRFDILSLVTFEANPIFARPEEDDFSWFEQAAGTKDRFEQAYLAKEPDASAIIIDYWGHDGYFASMPPAVQEFCRAHTYANILDWRCAAGFRPKVAEFAALRIPVTMVRGEKANESMTDITRAISDTIPNAKQRIVPGAGHFLISTHPEQCAQIIDQHMKSHGDQSG